MQIEPNTNYLVVKGNTLVEKGTKVRSPSPDKFENSRGAKNPDAILCSLTNGAGFYFTADELEPA